MLVTIFFFFSKVTGGLILLLLNSNYIVFSLLNVITFLIAALIMINIFPTLKYEMLKNSSNKQENKEKISLLKVWKIWQK